MHRCSVLLPLALLAAGCSASGPAVAPTADPEPVAVTPAVRSSAADEYRRAEEAEARGDHDEALARWTELHRKDPDYKDSAARLVEEYTVRGLDHFSRGDLDTAIRYWERAQTIAPDDARVHAYLDRARQEKALLAKLPVEDEGS